jgi:hypothetical protein
VKRTASREANAAKGSWKLLKSVGDAPPQYPDYEEEEEDDRPFEEKYELKKVGILTVATRREKK